MLKNELLSLSRTVCNKARSCIPNSSETVDLRLLAYWVAASRYDAQSDLTLAQKQVIHCCYTLLHSTINHKTLGELSALSTQLNALQSTIAHGRSAIASLHQNVRTAIKWGFGNCSEMSALAFLLLGELSLAMPTSRPIPVEFIKVTNKAFGIPFHAIVVLNRAENSTLTDPRTWGDDAVVCDPFTNESYLINDPSAVFASDLSKEMFTACDNNEFSFGFESIDKTNQLPPHHIGNLFFCNSYKNPTASQQAPWENQRLSELSDDTLPHYRNLLKKTYKENHGCCQIVDTFLSKRAQPLIKKKRRQQTEKFITQLNEAKNTSDVASAIAESLTTFAHHRFTTEIYRKSKTMWLLNKYLDFPPTFVKQHPTRKGFYKLG